MVTAYKTLCIVLRDYVFFSNKHKQIEKKKNLWLLFWQSEEAAYIHSQLVTRITEEREFFYETPGK